MKFIEEIHENDLLGQTNVSYVFALDISISRDPKEGMSKIENIYGTVHKKGE